MKQSLRTLLGAGVLLGCLSSSAFADVWSSSDGAIKVYPGINTPCPQNTWCLTIKGDASFEGVEMPAKIGIAVKGSEQPFFLPIKLQHAEIITIEAHLDQMQRGDSAIFQLIGSNGPVQGCQASIQKGGTSASGEHILTVSKVSQENQAFLTCKLD